MDIRTARCTVPEDQLQSTCDAVHLSIARLTPLSLRTVSPRLSARADARTRHASKVSPDLSHTCSTREASARPTRAMLDSTLRPPCVGPWTPTRSLSHTERSERPTREADTRRYRTARSWSPPPGKTRHTIRQIARCVLSFASPHAAHHAAYCTWASGHSRPCPRARVTPPT